MKKNKEEKQKEQKKCHCTEGEECTCGEECNCEDECTCGEECCCHNECSCDDELLVLNEKIKVLEEALLREKAEVQNYKRRKDDEISRMLKYADEKIILEFLPILDNFERAINMDDNNLEDEVSKFLSGFKMIYSQIKNMLEKFEVKEIEALNKKFDPTYHQGVATAKDESKESGIVLEVFQKGYIYKDRVIRPSMVKVNE